MHALALVTLEADFGWRQVFAGGGSVVRSELVHISRGRKRDERKTLFIVEFFTSGGDFRMH